LRRRSFKNYKSILGTGGGWRVNIELSNLRHGTKLLKRGFAKMQKGGVIMDVVNAEQARVAEEAGAVAVMALERVPADIRTAGGVARMADPQKIREIMDTVSIPVMAKVRIGHFGEAQILESLGVDMIDESEVLTPADPFYHVDKRKFEIPFVCGARSLGEAVRRINEGAAMIRTKGEAGTGNIVEAVRHQTLLLKAIEELNKLDDDGIFTLAEHYADKHLRLVKLVKSSMGLKPTVENSEPVFDDMTLETLMKGILEAILETKKLGRLPVVNFAAGGIATPADASLMMQLGSDGIFVGSGIFKSEQPGLMAKAVVEATMNFTNPKQVMEVSKGLGNAMKGLEMSTIPKTERLQERGV
jgi:pyridoxal 5'-phosphate synthase pdxS subunit